MLGDFSPALCELGTNDIKLGILKNGILHARIALSNPC